MSPKSSRVAQADGVHRHSTLVPSLLLVLSFVLVLLSIGAQAALGQSLFARSGSLMVLFAVMAEYMLMKGRDDHHGRQLAQSAGGERTDFSLVHPSGRHQVLEIAAHITTVVGTIIWGYGDLLY